jgi:hypothetical protein
MTDSIERNMGPQPLNILMEEAGLSNSDLVKSFEAQLSHKVVQKARTGRRITTRMQVKIAEAFNKATDPEAPPLKRDQLFNYR